MKTREPDVHDLVKGQIGYVCHKFTLLAITAWIRVWDDEERKGINLYTGVPIFENQPLKIASHGIPHGTPVLVTSEPTVLCKSHVDGRGTEFIFYRILWNELDCWVRRENMINPYFHGSPILPPDTDS